jgi:hypothetical protein
VQRIAPDATKARYPRNIFVLDHIGNAGYGVFQIRKITRALYICYLGGNSVEYDCRQHYVFGSSDLRKLNNSFRRWGGIPLPKTEIPVPVDGEEFRYIRSWVTVNDFSRFGGEEKPEFFIGRERRPFDLREFEAQSGK